MLGQCRLMGNGKGILIDGPHMALAQELGVDEISDLVTSHGNNNLVLLSSF